MLPNLVFARVEVSRNRTGSLDAGAGVQVQKVSELAWWPTLYHDVERWVSTCAVCKLTKPQKALTAELRSQLYLRPFRVLIIDTIGPITPAVRAFEFILHASCPFFRLPMVPGGSEERRADVGTVPGGAGVLRRCGISGRAT